MNIDDLVNAMRTGGWIDDADNATGLSMDVDAAAAWDTERFALRSPPEATVFELEWLGDGNALADVDRDFYRFYGRFAEEYQLIRRSVEPDAITYEVLVGAADHGHHAVFRISGPLASAVADSYLALVTAQRGSR